MEIVMGLFGSMVPLRSLTLFYDKFMLFEWEAFYRILMNFYRHL